MRGIELVGRYDLFLLDAYGVLVTSEGPLPHAADFLQALKEAGTPYYIVTNDASRLPEKATAFYQRQGLPIPIERVLTSGLAIQPALRTLTDAGASASRTGPLRCAVLGTLDTHEYVRRAGFDTSDGPAVPGGTEIVAISDEAVFDALVIGDDSGFDTLPTLNALLSSLTRMVRRGHPFRLLLANPDLLYPRGDARFGFTSGALARLIEIGLEQLHPERVWKFDVLGKPSPLMYQMGIARAQAELQRPLDLRRVVMFGDQLHTDVRGSHAAGVDSALLLTGITRAFDSAGDRGRPEARWNPTHILESL